MPGLEYLYEGAEEARRRMQIGHWGDGRGCRSYSMFFGGSTLKSVLQVPEKIEEMQVQEMHATSILA